VCMYVCVCMCVCMYVCMYVCDGVPFNPLSEKAPDIDAPLEEREIGGLGIHLVRNLIDDVTYHRRIGKNVMTLTQHLE